MKTTLTKKGRAALEQYVARHARIQYSVRKPYIVATCALGNTGLTGIGFAKWNPNDANAPKWTWNEARGHAIASGRAILDLIAQMDSATLAAYVDAAIAEQGSLPVLTSYHIGQQAIAAP